MAGPDQNTPALRSFHELCEKAFGSKQIQHEQYAPLPEHDAVEAPFEQCGSRREWMAAEAGRLYSLQVSDHDCARGHNERSPGAGSRSLSTVSTIRVEYGSTGELATQLFRRRESWARRSWGALRRLSNAVTGALPVRMPSFRWSRTATFADLERWSMAQEERRGRSPGPRRVDDNDGDIQAQMMMTVCGNVC